VQNRALLPGKAHHRAHRYDVVDADPIAHGPAHHLRGHDDLTRQVEWHGATAAGVIIALDRQERGQGEWSAVQEVERAYHIPVTRIVTLDDLVAYLVERPEYAESLATLRAYRERYGVGDYP
jgi:hypothetical protein